MAEFELKERDHVCGGLKGKKDKHECRESKNEAKWSWTAEG